MLTKKVETAEDEAPVMQRSKTKQQRLVAMLQRLQGATIDS